jgi:hypothetical protein
MWDRVQVRGDRKIIVEMEALKLQTVKAIGLCPIKQVELYNKFRPFVPHEYLEDTCPRPSHEVLAQVEDETIQCNVIYFNCAFTKLIVPKEGNITLATMPARESWVGAR